MFLIAKLLDYLDRSCQAQERNRREEWLGQATSIADLEARMRDLDRGQSHITAFGDSIRIR